MKLNGLVVLSLSIILLTSVYAWVNRHHYHIYTGGDFNFVIRENIFTMDRCTLRLGFLDTEVVEIIQGDSTSRAEKSVFPGFCKDTPDTK